MRPVLLGLVLALLAPAAPAAAETAPPPVVRAERKPLPKLKITPVVRDLDHPWDVRALPGGALIFTQRDRATLSVFKNGKVHRVAFPRAPVWVSGETGLMGLEVDPDFANNRRIYTCQGGFTGGGHDVHVTAWTLDASCARRRRTGSWSAASRPARAGTAAAGWSSPATGRCSSAPATPPSAPTRRTSTRSAARRCGWTGSPGRRGRATRSPSATGPRRYVHTYGHRNVQGVAERADGTLWSIEQGTYRDDEVNLLVNGGDYG